MTATFYAPAKINLTLEVLARRADGLHGVRSVMVPLELADELRVTEGARFGFTCDRGDLARSDNLVVRAVRALGAPPARQVELRKVIPTQAGLGGGSSDAAAVLRAAMSGAFGEVAPTDWIAAARALGSDVAFFLAGSAALVEGTGERVTPLGTTPRWHVLVVKPPVGVSTTDAYARMDRSARALRSRRASVSLAMATALQRGDFAGVRALLHNDFQEPVAAAMAEVATALDALRSAGAQRPLLAGSGSCVFALAEHRDELAAIAGRLSLPPEYARFQTAFAAAPLWRA